MIPVQAQPQPTDFDEKVAKPGARYLSATSRPVNWRNREYWRAIIPELYTIYDGVCAYCAEWISSSTGVSTVDHFVPKSVSPNLAYEWGNFRLACLKLNSWKGDYQDVLDPFLLQPDWFVLEFPSLLIKPHADLAPHQREQVETTIKRLRLNADDGCVRARLRWIKDYCRNKDYELLSDYAPFIAYELRRQDLLDDIVTVMSL